MLCDLMEQYIKEGRKEGRVEACSEVTLYYLKDQKVLPILKQIVYNANIK